MLRRGNGAPIEVKVKRAPTSSRPSPAARGREYRLYPHRRLRRRNAGGARRRGRRTCGSRAGNKLIGFILDLRNNPGGNFDAAVAVADAFIDKGDIAVVKGRKPDSLKRIAATPGDIAKGCRSSRWSTAAPRARPSSSPARLQDNRRAVLLGTKTFGESAIERLIPLNGNGAIRLTTARFLTPSGRQIQGKGLDPDLAVSPVKLAKVAQADRRARGRSARRVEEHRPGALGRQGAGPRSGSRKRAPRRRRSRRRRSRPPISARQRRAAERGRRRVARPGAGQRPRDPVAHSGRGPALCGLLPARRAVLDGHEGCGRPIWPTPRCLLGKTEVHRGA